MLYNISFQDNIYILLRQIDTTNNGLKLDLDSNLFGQKVILDLVFFDKTIKRLFTEISKQTSLPNFLDILQCMHFCIAKYLELLRNVKLCESSLADMVKNNWHALVDVAKEQEEILLTIEECIAKNDSDVPQQEMVSTNELAELLSS